MTVSGVEFIRRFLLHVLPFRFVKIRYYGFLANICRKKSVFLIRRLTGKDMSPDTDTSETTRERLIRLTGRDIFLCSQCGCGTMIFKTPATTIRYRITEQISAEFFYPHQLIWRATCFFRENW